MSKLLMIGQRIWYRRVLHQTPPQCLTQLHVFADIAGNGATVVHRRFVDFPIPLSVTTCDISDTQPPISKSLHGFALGACSATEFCIPNAVRGKTVIKRSVTGSLHTNAS